MFVNEGSKLADASKEQDVFKCPLVPLLPCLGIYSNFVLCTTVGISGWVLFLLFEGFGVLFYLFYGFKHSNMTNRVKKHKE